MHEVLMSVQCVLLDVMMASMRNLLNGMSEQGLLGPETRVANDLLEAVWSGCACQPPGKGREAPATAFSECLSWLLTQVSRRSLPAVQLLDTLACWKVSERSASAGWVLRVLLRVLRVLLRVLRVLRVLLRVLRVFKGVKGVVKGIVKGVS